jgi:LytS/YehU family sensor histidine kinase
MLEDLIVYLRAALPHLRESSSTVGQEATLARAWLDIVGRSEPAWKVTFDVAAAAHEARLPALVLLPLLQHAVAAAEGAALALAVSMRLDAGRLRIEVTTTTAAFARGIAGAPILEQIADRLKALYGDSARFEVRGPDAGADGSRAEVEIPLEASASGESR